MGHRGSNLADGRVTIDEGMNWCGVRSQLHFEGDQLIVQHTYDAEPILDHVQELREAQEGQNWGDGKLVGTIPMHDWARFIAPIRGRAERDAALLDYFKARPKLVAFDKFIKG